MKHSNKLLLTLALGAIAMALGSCSNSASSSAPVSSSVVSSEASSSVKQSSEATSSSKETSSQAPSSSETSSSEATSSEVTSTAEPSSEASSDVSSSAATSLGDDVLLITEAGDYTLEKDYKQIYVNAPDAAVTIGLNGHTVENSENSPIYVETADSVDISAGKGTSSFIKDTRETYTEDVEGQGKGAIYVEDGDLTLKGNGNLTIEAGYLNGVHGKDDVKIQKLTLDVKAVGHGIRGNDSITMKSGNVSIECGGDGLHSENSDISSKGKQRGNITVSGGTLTVNSWGDAIAAAYDAILNEAEGTLVYTAKTNKYSSYDGEVIDTSANAFYLKMSGNVYGNGNYTYAAKINDAWYKATYKGTQESGGGFPGGGPGGPGGSTYYYYELEKPSGATSFTLYRFSGTNATPSETDYDAKGDAKAFNDAYDTVQIQGVSSSKISFGSWSNYSSGGANKDVAEVSAKGIKAENEVTISGGTIDIKAYDDGIHANNDGSLENGETPKGNVNIEGGALTVWASDDGIHGDGELNISGGEVNVTNGYEGLEANVIKISGGSTYVLATDDGVNATKGNATPNVTVSGGLLDVAVPSSGDTDGIDSNGTFTQTGGTVIVKGPGTAGQNAFGAAALDSESTISLSGGSLIVFGGIEKTPSTSLTRTLCTSNTVSSGNHTISFASESYTTTLKYSYRGCIVYSELGTATLA